MIAFGYDVLYNSFTVVKVVRPWKEDNMAKFDDFDLDIRKLPVYFKSRSWPKKIPQVNLDYYWPGELVKSKNTRGIWNE